jgi:hypothetical protein
MPPNINRVLDLLLIEMIPFLLGVRTERQPGFFLARAALAADVLPPKGYGQSPQYFLAVIKVPIVSSAPFATSRA